MSSLFQKLFAPTNSKEQGKMINDELPVDDPDELAVEEEFKNKAAGTAPVKKPAVEEKRAPASTTATNAASASAPQAMAPRPSKPKTSMPSPAATSTAPQAGAAPQPAKAAAMPSSATSSPDMDRLRSIAKSSGLSTSMDNIGQEDGGMMFDIEVLEEGDDGRPMTHVERGVSASSEAELRGLYAMSDQKIRIIRRYGEPSAGVGAQPAALPAQQMGAPVRSGASVAQPQAPAVEKAPEPPKYFTVSGVECKLENGKVYQRQWVRLAGADAEAFRLVNDANNKIVPIDGKHIEQKKWVLIQENADEGE